MKAVGFLFCALPYQGTGPKRLRSSTQHLAESGYKDDQFENVWPFRLPDAWVVHWLSIGKANTDQDDWRQAKPGHHVSIP